MIFYIIFFYIFSICGCTITQTVINRGDFYVTNEMKASNLELIGPQSLLQCRNIKANIFKVKEMMVSEIRSQKLWVKNIYPNKMGYIQLYGDMQVKGEVNWMMGEPQMRFEEVDEMQKASQKSCYKEPQQMSLVQQHIEEEREKEVIEFFKAVEEQNVELQSEQDQLKTKIQTEEFSRTHNIQNISRSFLQTDSMILNDVKQWGLIESESFNYPQMSKNILHGWKIKNVDNQIFRKIFKQEKNLISLENDDDDYLISASFNQTLYKIIKDIPPHKHLKLEGLFFFLSALWQGEAAYIKVDGKIVWMEHHDWKEFNQDICNMSASQIQELYWQSPLNVVIKHNKPEVEIEIYTTQDKQKYFRDLDCLENIFIYQKLPLYGFDDFHIYQK